MAARVHRDDATRAERARRLMRSEPNKIRIFYELIRTGIKPKGMMEECSFMTIEKHTPMFFSKTKFYHLCTFKQAVL